MTFKFKMFIFHFLLIWCVAFGSAPKRIDFKLAWKSKIVTTQLKVVETKNDIQDTSQINFSIFSKFDDALKHKLTEEIESNSLYNKAAGAMVGMAIGDYIGAPLEFIPTNATNRKQSSFDPENLNWNNIKNAFELEIGQWTDDTSMGLCMADSLLSLNKYDGSDIRIRFHNWWYHGYNNAFRFNDQRKSQTSVGLGGNIAQSLKSMKSNTNITPIFQPSKPSDDSGNGSIMRLAAIPIFFHKNINQTIEMSIQSSFTTHPGYDASEACAFMSFIIVKALTEKQSITDKNIQVFMDNTVSEYDKRLQKEIKELETADSDDNEIDNDKKKESKNKVLSLVQSKGISNKEINWNWKHKNMGVLIDQAVKNRGSNYNGYPVDLGYFGSYSLDGLAIGLHSVYHSNSLIDAITRAVNLLGDADTTGAITGQIAGAIYGYQSIDQKYIDALNKWDNNNEIALRGVLLAQLGTKLPSQSTDNEKQDDGETTEKDQKNDNLKKSGNPTLAIIVASTVGGILLIAIVLLFVCGIKHHNSDEK